MTSNNRIPFIAGNWKMHNTVEEAIELVRKIIECSQDMENIKLVVIPPFTSLFPLKSSLKETKIALGAQDVYWEDKGAFTGEISPSMLKNAGCQYVIIGHSERRQYFGETNKTSNKKIRAALRTGLIPILCLGESFEERERDHTFDKIEKQINEGLAGLDKEEVRNLILAYEPIWAIGTGQTASSEQAQEVHNYIRTKLAEKYGNQIADCVIILYGGSVKPDNAYSLLQEKDINGALVGGASLKGESFCQIAKEAIRAYRKKK